MVSLSSENGERQEGGNKRQEWTLYKTKFAISKEYLTEKYNYIKEWLDKLAKISKWQQQKGQFKWEGHYNWLDKETL